MFRTQYELVKHGIYCSRSKTVIDNHPEVKDGQDIWQTDDANVQTLAPSALVPMLVKAIQEQQAIIESLTTRITALEGRIDMSEAVERTAEEKAQMYSAMLGSVSVITNCLDDDNEFCNDMTKAEKKERVMRSSGYLSMGVALDDWGSEDMSSVNAAIKAAEDYDPDA